MDTVGYVLLAALVIGGVMAALWALSKKTVKELFCHHPDCKRSLGRLKLSEAKGQRCPHCHKPLFLNPVEPFGQRPD
jgi:hypothetical protein